ncbi:MAG: hypothetical protein ACREEV_13195 [Dongiaceae bacterium]
MIKTFFSVAMVAATLSGCSLFSQPSQKDWNRASGGSDQTSADLSACRQQANAVIQRDSDIDSDIAAARVEESDPESTSAAEITGIDEYDTRNRYDRIVNDCMRGRGYVLPEKKSIFE